MAQFENIIPNKRKAIFCAQRQLPLLVYDAVNIGGIHYTISEIQTLIDGVTVGDHQIRDQMIALNQIAAWNILFELLESNQFALTKEVACKIHEIAAKEEATEWGLFRCERVTTTGATYQPAHPEKLDLLWEKMVNEANEIDNIYDKAIFVFLQISRSQFFYDDNKRLGRFMMNGILLAAGYPAINLPSKRQEEFKQLMLDFYLSTDTRPMTQFMKSCLDETTIEIMSEKVS